MASESGSEMNKRFAQNSAVEIQNILNSKASDNTKRATKAALTVLTQYLVENNMSTDLNSFSSQELADTLTSFYADARKKNGDKYKLSGLRAIRFGLARHFSSESGIDIIKDPDFKKANDVFLAVCVNLKRDGLGKTEHTPAIEVEDLKTIYTSFALDPDTPVGLLQKVWFDIMYYLCRRGRENLRLMTKETFKISVDAHGRKFVYQDVDELDKNHHLDSDPTANVTDGRMYEIKGHSRCPVLCFKKYLSKLNPSNNNLWQRPVDSFDNNENVWYTKQPVGKNTLAKMLPNICKQAVLKTLYNNYSLRATSITILNVNNFSSRDIMSVSGHKSESSLKRYTGKVGTKRKHDMSEALSAALIETSETNLQVVECTTDCDGVLDLSPDQIDALFDNSFQVEKESISSSGSLNVKYSVSFESVVANCRFVPYITGCVVNFNINK